MGGWGDFICMPVDGVVTELPKRKSAPRESFVAAIHRHCSAPGVIRIRDTSPFEALTNSVYQTVRTRRCVIASAVMCSDAQFSTCSFRLNLVGFSRRLTLSCWVVGPVNVSKSLKAFTAQNKGGELGKLLVHRLFDSLSNELCGSVCP